jgi:hypothetical protein
VARKKRLKVNEWLAADNPYPMFDYLGRAVSCRKLRLFGIACCRRIWHLMKGRRCRRAVILAERLVEGEPVEEEVAHLRDQLKSDYLELNERMYPEDKVAQVRLWCMGAACNLLQDEDAYLSDVGIGAGDADLLRVWYSASSAVGYDYSEEVVDPPPSVMLKEHQAQANLLREVLGNPLCPVTFDPGWRTSAAVGLALTIYEDRVFDRMPILGDALEDAGCDNLEFLDHCRGSATHVRGCWAIDLVLGRT